MTGFRRGPAGTEPTDRPNGIPSGPGGTEPLGKQEPLGKTQPLGRAVQERYAPGNHCFGCGPANPMGLQIRSFEDEEGLVPEWTPAPHHEAFDGAVSGGILGTLLDCHSNWTAAIHLMKAVGRDTPPCTVTSEFHVKLLRVTPSNAPLRLQAKVVDSSADRATVEATVVSGGRRNCDLVHISCG